MAWIDDKVQVSTLTVGELRRVISDAMADRKVETCRKSDIARFAGIFGVSQHTARAIRQCGCIDSAINWVGSTMYIDVAKAKEILVNYDFKYK